MTYYVGLDVSNKETSICILNEKGNVVKEAKVKSEPEAIHRYLTKQGYKYEKIGLEAGALSNWLVKGLKNLGLHVICIDSRAMAAVISVRVNKTDRNDAKAIANAMRCDNYKEVHIKSDESVKTNSFLTTRKALVETKKDLENTVRGMLKTYGVKLKRNIKSYPVEVRNINSFDDFMPEGKPTLDLEIFEPLLKIIEEITRQLEELDLKLKKIAEQDRVCKRFMTMDGVGPITALSYKCEIDDPRRFKNSRSIGAYLGMTSNQYSSGEKVVQGRISKCGSIEVRSLLITGANVVINKCKRKSKMKSWGLKKKRELGNPKAKVALGRKMAVILHRMWMDEADFDPQIDADKVCPEEQRLQREKEVKKEIKQVKAAKQLKKKIAKKVA
jgi:transposase